jgi:hypothetical protein
MSATVRERFEAKYEAVTESGCWLWTASTGSHGYGQLMVFGAPRLAHRVSWELAFGAIPEGMYVCHRCDTRSCVNPAHLFLGSARDNSLDMMAKGRHTPNTGCCAGEKNPSAKLTAENVIAIRRDERLPRVIAADFGVSVDTIRLVKKRSNWRSVA